MDKNYIGIDVSSEKLNIHITGKLQGEDSDFEIKNSSKALKNFIKKYKLLPENFIVGVESTSRYHLICQNFFVPLGFEFRVLNPILTGKKISASIRKKKTDKSDSKIIALLLSQGEGHVISENQLDTTKRSILRTRSSLVGKRSSIKVMIQDLQRINDNKQIRNTIKTLEKLISDLDKSIKKLEDNAYSKVPTKTEKLIGSVPGFATNLSSVVASEVGDFHRFPSAKQFKAYVGIDPKISQSGNSLHSGKITKRGNPYLRRSFYLAAVTAKKFDPELKEFYEKKVGEGKIVRVALCAVARKLCERVYAVAVRGIPYEKRGLSFS